MEQYYIKDFKRFICIGKDTRGKKFRLVYSNYYHADCINMWTGRLWGELHNGKRVLLKTVNC